VNLGLSKAVSQVFSTKPETEKKAENNTPPAAEKKTTDYISDTYKFFTKRSEDVPLLNFSKTKTDTSKTPADVDQVQKKYNELSKKLDQDGDGFVTKRELVRMVNDKNVKGEDAALVGTLLNKYFDICDAGDDEFLKDDDGITAKDIKNLGSVEKLKNLDSSYFYYSSKINSAFSLRKPDGSLKIPTKASEINYKDIQQGSNGDCYFLAALTSLAQRYPQKIVDMLKDNNNGTYTVKFADKAVTINSPTDTELGMYAQGGSWVPIIEKAYAHYRNDKNLILNMTDPYDASDGAYQIGRAIKELTGSSFDTDFLHFKTTHIFDYKSEGTTREKLTEAFKNNKLVVASINPDLLKRPDDLNLPSSHVYTVVNFDTEKNTVTVRNPWGSTEPYDKNGRALDGRDDGEFTLSFAKFFDYFNSISYQQ
jgi:hypothetical protein